MEFLARVLDVFLHLDKHLNTVVESYGVWTYALLGLVVFCETGLVVLPLLPGDSLLFAAGAVGAATSIDLKILFGILSVAAVVGDTVNYWIGCYVGPKIFSLTNRRFLNAEHLRKTQEFYEKYGGKTIILARFIPIIRTFAPFVAGIGRMNYGKFFLYNVVGGVVWVAAGLSAGYFFRNLPFVRDHFTLVVLGIVFISILPAVIEFLRHKNAKPSEVQKV